MSERKTVIEAQIEGAVGEIADHEEEEDEEEEEHPLVRTRTMTEKGRAYVKTTKMKRLVQLCRGLEKNMAVILDMMDSDSDPKDVHRTFKIWLGLYESFIEVDVAYRDLLSIEQLDNYQGDWFETRNTVMVEFKDTAVNWLAKTKHGEEDNKTSSRCSTKSDRTESSRHSKAEVRRAELAVKAVTLKKRQALEEEKLQLKYKEQQLQLEEEIALSDVQSQRSRKKNESLGSTNSSNSSVKSSQHNSKTTQHSNHSDAVLSVVRHLKRPTVELSRFGGDPLHYKRFMRQFKTKIVENCDSYDDKLCYLEQYTFGEPQQIVIGCSYMDAKDGYEAAIKEFDQRYGDQEVIVNAYVNKALTWTQVRADNPKELDKFSVFLKECGNAIKSIDALRVLEYSENLKRLVMKLPYPLQEKWRSVVCQIKDRSRHVKFQDLADFVEKEAKKANDPTYGRNALYEKREQGTHKPKTSKGSFANAAKENQNESSKQKSETNKFPEKKTSSSPKDIANAATSQDTSSPVLSAFTVPCLFCENKQHSMDGCTQLSSQQFGERIRYLRSKGLCFGCLRRGHSQKFCRNKATCQQCRGMHPTVLHIKHPQNETSKEAVTPKDSGYNRSGNTQGNTTAVGQCHTGAGDVDCALAVIPVTLKSTNGMITFQTYAFLDPGSNVSFCSEQVIEKLGIHGKKVRISMDTMGETHNMDTQKVEGVEVGDVQGRNFIKLPALYTKDRMPISNEHIPRLEDISSWQHLQGVILPQINSEVGILIGNNVPDAYSPIDIKTGPRGSPHAVKSLLGWIVWNVIRNRLPSELTANHAEVTAIQETEELHKLELLYQRSVQLDFPERVLDDKLEPSQEDLKFQELVHKSLTLKNGHYELCLPFKSEDVKLPDNYVQATQRLKHLKKKLLNNEEFRKNYTTFMDQVVEKGYAVKVPEQELSRADGRVWYLPHHGVYHPRKAKIRVVFDCAAVYRGVALNRVLLQGPDYMNNLIGVLLRFQQHSVAVTSDIEAMFHQVKVPPEDQDCLRFLWWPEGDVDAEPCVYRMVVHLFGAVSSPTCCILALQKAARDQHREFPAASEAVLRNFYMDDFLISLSTEDEAIALVKDVTEVCANGGFRLTKWISNSTAVLESVPEIDRAVGLRDLTFDKLPTERVLGVYWDISTDSFGFSISHKDVLPTRRRVLSTVCSVFDPLGMGAPFILTAKILLQDLCRQNIGWDAKLSDADLLRWKRWVTDLPKLEKLCVSRCLKPADFGEVACLQLHYFSDASELGYGVAVYIRYTNTHGKIHVRLLISKARVAPIKKTTIPRLELTAAMVAVKLHRKLQDELDINIDSVIFWTDSMAVLRYIGNQNTRFHTFVANRLTIIQEGSSIQQWHYVESSKNPADMVSRGLSADALLQSDLWLKGPHFLREPFDKWMQKVSYDQQLCTDDPEVKKQVHAVPGTQVIDDPIDLMFQRISSWLKLKRVYAWTKLYIRRLQCHVNQQAGPPNSLDESMLKQAEVELLQHVQKQHFHEDLKRLEKNSTIWIKKYSSLSRLDPVIGTDGLLRVGGRLGESEMPYEARHPVILPRESAISQLILQKIHQDVGHLGRNSMLSLLRQHYWIVGASAAIRKLLAKCVICRKYKADTMEQKMANLPADRITPDYPVFTKVGVDYFGPFHVKRGRSKVKRYGVIFTCLTSRAVHLEVSHTLDTDSCISAIRRFVARRGPVKIMYSDNGTNLVGAEKELRSEVQRWNHTKFGEIPNITWKFNPPGGSHFGGVWERLIRSIRKILYSLVHQQTYHMDDEGLQTLFCEVEAIMNNRPLTYVSSDLHDIQVLTPNHLLLLQSGESLPCGTFSSDENYARRRWRQIQYLANQFWARWVREYLPTLQARQKWLRPHRNVAVGDVVLVVDNSPRNSWTLGRILEVIADSKGIIRVVKVKTPTTVLTRPVHKLCMILETDLDSQ